MTAEISLSNAITTLFIFLWSLLILTLWTLHCFMESRNSSISRPFRSSATIVIFTYPGLVTSEIFTILLHVKIRGLSHCYYQAYPFLNCNRQSWYLGLSNRFLDHSIFHQQYLIISITAIDIFDRQSINWSIAIDFWITSRKLILLLTDMASHKRASADIDILMSQTQVMWGKIRLK